MLGRLIGELNAMGDGNARGSDGFNGRNGYGGSRGWRPGYWSNTLIIWKRTAIKTGIRQARGKVLVCMDADGQHSPEDIARFIGECERFDMVVGARSSASQAGWHRSLANRIYNAFASYVTGRKIEDLTSGYRAMRRSVALHFVGLLPNGFSYPTTITLCMLRAGFSVAYIPIEAAKRVGKSGRILSDGTKFLLVIMKICRSLRRLRYSCP